VLCCDELEKPSTGMETFGFSGNSTVIEI
jgi:hypothetical protein